MRLLRGELKVCEAGLSANSIFPLSVNYNRSIEDSIKVGKYDSVNSDIASEHFQSNETGEKKVAIELLNYFAKIIKWKNIIIKNCEEFQTRAGSEEFAPGLRIILNCRFGL